MVSAFAESCCEIGLLQLQETDATVGATAELHARESDFRM